MLTSRHPRSPTSDQAVIDEQAHTRYTSVSYSQRSDSPSIYSRAEYSPNTQSHARGDWLHSGYQTSLSGQDRSSFDDDDDDALTFYTRNSYDQDDRSLYPPADDDVSFISALAPRPPLLHPSPVPSAEGSPSEETVEDTRMRLGPKMRYVSRAPWEFGDGLLEEEEEEGEGEPGSATASTFSDKTRRSRDQDKPTAKGLGFTTRSRSPGPLPAPGRKGSGGTNGMYRQQTRESQGGPYGPHLSGASHSHSAIPTVTSSSRSSHSATDSLSSDKYPYGRARTVSPVEPFPFPTHPFRPQDMSYSSRGGSAPSIRSASPSHSDRCVHPYANPDLLPAATSAPPVPLPRTPAPSHERAFDEREKQISPLRRTSESTSSSPPPPPPPHTTGLRKASAGGLPLPAMPPRTLFGEQDGRADTSHLGAQPKTRSSSRPVPSSPVGPMVVYGDQPGSPMHNLITLEQARARAQNAPNRGQGQSGYDGNTYTPRSTPSSTLVAGLGLAPGVIVENSVRGPMQRQDFSHAPFSDPSQGPSMQHHKMIPHPRPPTANSGKHMAGSDSSATVDGSAVPAKTIKHKRSAFMKLFQGKEKDRDRDAKASDYPIRSMSTPPQLPPSNSETAPPLPSAALHNIKRIPPPLPLSVVVTSPSFPASGTPTRPSQEEPSTKPASPPRLRQASAPLPAASHSPAQTSAQGPSVAASESQPPGTLSSDLSRPTASAPPTQTAFQGLSLRPVSTIFSAKFPELLAPAETTAVPSIIRRVEEPPTTPGFSYSRSNSTSTASDPPMTPTLLPLVGPPPALGAIQSEDPSNVIVALQEQIVNSRKMWQQHIWELEGQIRNLKVEVEELRSTGECETCGAARRERVVRAPVPQNVGVVDRPRPRLGSGNTRTVFGGGGDL
ncbi:hypothetical protein JB92DRAFT_3114265 [Gautieria morchelliformis]|nr:hypothetical protein JB92DRAFT_3114265 [Gautieria morchelliformis]